MSLDRLGTAVAENQSRTALFFTIAELLLSPVGLSLSTKLAPAA